MLALDASRPAERIGPAQPWSSRRWCDYFRQRGALLVIPWERGADLTPAERDQIAPSLQVFQQGESHEGGHFYRCARAHAEASGDAEYVTGSTYYVDGGLTQQVTLY